MKKLKRIFLVLLAVILTVGSVANVSAAVTSFTDTNTHWAWTRGYIPYLVEKNVLNGYPQSGGTYAFKPDKEISRAEFIKMIDEAFGLTETKAISFSDVKSTDWFYVYFQKAAAQGYLLNYGTKCDPNGFIPREEAISLLVRYLNLDPEQKASATTFSDYNQISEKYRDYVLEAIYAGITEGYEQSDGSYLFKPANTLTRAEALTIIYRAAGCIYNKNSYVRDSGAAPTNSVITKGNITIQDQTLNGKTIISEGANDGIVTFSNCTIDGTLYVRGNAKVYFDKCKVNDVVVTGNGGISLLTSSTVKSITLQKKATVSVTKGTKVETLNVGANAANSSVIGEGVVNKITVRSTGFTSQIMPSEYEIFNGHSATFAGKTYTGTQDDNGIFTVPPFATADKDYFYIEFTATKDGTAYYYYTNSTTVPSAEEFDEQYRKSNFKGYIPVKANTAVSQKTYSVSQLKDYKYAVVMLQNGTTKYAPVLVSNSATGNDGFSTAPYYSETDNSIKFKVAVNGTVYMFYTDSADSMTQSKFLAEYNNCESALKKSVAATTTSVSSVALNAGYADKYGYVALMLKSASGTYYTPVIVPIADDGFAIVPEVKTSGTIAFKTDVSGTMYYYYSKTNEVPTSAGFDKVYKAATYTGSMLVAKNTAATLSYKPSYASVYPYMIVCIKTADGYKLPVCVELGYESGFTVLPKLVSNTLISFTTEAAGKVQYYFTNNATAPSSEIFSAIFSSMDVLKRGTVPCYYQDFEGFIAIPEGITEKYIVLMLTDSSNNAYAPIVLSLTYNPNDLITGFVYTPYIKSGEVYIRTASATSVRFYYSEYTSSVSSEEFYTNYNKANAMYKGTLSVEADTLYKHKIDSTAKIFGYRTIVLATWNGTSYGEPVVLSAFEDTSRPGNTAGLTFTVYQGIVLATPSYTGTLYYYATDDKADAGSVVFDKAKASSVAVTAGKATPVDSGSKKYVILCLEANDITFDKVAIDISTGKQYVPEVYDDGSSSTSTNLNIIANDATSHTIAYQPLVDGYVSFTLVGDNERISFNGSTSDGNVAFVEVDAGDLKTLDYSAAYEVAQADTTHSHVYLYIQMYGFPTTRYKSIVITLK